MSKMSRSRVKRNARFTKKNKTNKMKKGFKRITRKRRGGLGHFRCRDCVPIESPTPTASAAVADALAAPGAGTDRPLQRPTQTMRRARETASESKWPPAAYYSM